MDPDGRFTELNSNDDFSSIVDLLNGKSSYCKVPIELQYEPESDFQYSDAGYCIIQNIQFTPILQHQDFGQHLRIYLF